MTSRPNLGGSQPQRSLSANIIQRPPPNRTLSQQFPPSSPAAKRSNEGLVDPTVDGPEAAQGRYGTIPRNGGSRLKLEISKDSKTPTLVESPKPTSAATPTWKPSLPPRGRPQRHFDLPNLSNLSPRPPAQEGGNIDAPMKAMPLPARPGHHTPPVHDKARVLPGNSTKRDARPKPYVLEVPTVAPRYPPNGHSDFFPWTGNHPEDQFSETAIRQGFYDKAQMTQNETGSGKPSIFPQLKHKSGLQMLSSLFTTVLAQRRAHGQITASSTFKPPPRVTVTDTKREIWLKDLANPTIPLRRLSRSIPHGIRGKVLLDQSLSKNIPIERAVWLAKCVGANELRSFRRKSATGTFAMGGEAKWIRDFTVCVEQFIESIVSVCGEESFRSRINYAIRLAAQFYAEHLLDREHYMDWLVSTLENSPQTKLPMWLLITQIYWKDLGRYRKYGRRLSAAMLNQLAETINHPDSDVLTPLSDRLKVLLKDLMISNPNNFICPKIWTKHCSTIQSTLDDIRSRALFASIDRRNDRLAGTAMKSDLSSRRRLINSLDATISRPFTPALINEYWQMEDDKSVLIQTLLEWSTSSYRPGVTKIFIAARMLRQWSRLGVDITDAVLLFLDSKVSERGRDKAAFYHLISELTRSEHFSISVYLQWIIARGGLDEAADIARDGPCATRLLAELPTHNLSESVAALRTTLLGRINFIVDEEEVQTRLYMISLNNQLPGMQADADLELGSGNLIVGHPMELYPRLNQTNKSEIGLWLRQKVGLHVLQPSLQTSENWPDSSPKEGISAITAFQFSTVRFHLELLEDYSILADVLKIVSSSSDPEVLASCADTLSLNSDTFTAIGALSGLFDVLMTRLRSISEDEIFPRVLLVALSDLAAKIPDQKIVSLQLAQELVRSDRKTAADACSPVSDQMAGAMQTVEADFTDEIEKVLASGNSMDQPTLERLFQRIALRLESSWEKSPGQSRSCGLLFTRLRTFDAHQFDLLMSAWVTRFLQMQSRPCITEVLGPLISFGCLSLRDILANFETEVTNGMAPTGQGQLNVSEEMLALIVASPSIPEATTVEESYRLRVKQNQLQRDHHEEVLFVISQAIRNSRLSSTGDLEHRHVDIKNLFTSHEFYELLQRLSLVHTEATIRLLVGPLIQSTHLGAIPTLTSIVDRLLVAERHIDRQRQVSIETVLELADDFTLPFCQIKLASMFNTDNAGTDTSEEGSSGRLAAFDTAIESTVSTENIGWACILPLLDVSIAQYLRARAETQFFALFPSPKSNAEDIAAMSSRVKQAENLLHIIDTTAFSMTASSSNSALVPDIVMAFNSVWFFLTNPQSRPPEIKDLLFTKWLPLLLSFTTIHISAFENMKIGHESKAKAVFTISAIFLELQTLEDNTNTIATLTERCFDLALQLVDLLPDDLRQQSICGLRDLTSNPSISYIFSIAPNPAEWLLLSQKEKITGAAAADGRSTITEKEKLTPYPLRRWEMLEEPTPNIGENDTSLNLTLFGARRV